MTPYSDAEPTPSDELHNNAARQALLLRGAAALLLVTGGSLLWWLIDKAAVHPWTRVADELPFWIPFGITVVGGLVAMSYLFLRAARRVRRGEDLFARRHRRHPSDPGDDR